VGIIKASKVIGNQLKEGKVKKIFMSILLVSFILSGCSLFKPQMPKAMKDNISELLKDEAVLNAETEQGVTYANYSQQLAVTKGAYDLAVSVWPEKYQPEAKKDFDNAFTGWKLAADLWYWKINQYDEPVEPNINHYQDYINYGGNNLVIETHPSDFIVEKYQGKKFVSFDNISALLTMASNDFSKGQALLIKDMK
jgi:hypothetical protein